MSESTSFSKSPEQLAQDALEHLRVLCKGNGVKLESIQILRHTISLHTLHAGTYLELRPVTNEREAPGKIVAGQMVGSREEATKNIDTMMAGAASDPSVRAQITQSLLSRPDKGFGLNGQPINLDFLRREYTWHEACQTCRGSGNAACLKCHGKRVEACIKCSARGLMFCPLCRGTGLLQGVKCSKCFGQRYVPCDMCRKTGVMPCRTCHGHGTGKCPSCGGAGWRSHILSIAASAMTYFEYDPKSIPQHAAHVIEASGPALAQSGKVKLEGRIADDKENAIGASYDVTFPYGEIEFTLAKKEVKAGIFGYQGDLVNLPHILDRLVMKGIEELEETGGSVSEKIRSATRYRLIAQGFLYAVRTTPQKAVTQLMKKYDAGLSQSMAERIVTAAERALTQISQRPRARGMAAGVAAIAVFTSVYYLTPVRSSVASFLPDPKFDAVLDILPILLGGFIVHTFVRAFGAGSVQGALGHLLPENEKKSLAPKPGKAALVGYASAAGFSLLLMEICLQLGFAAPWWYNFLRGVGNF